ELDLALGRCKETLQRIRDLARPGRELEDVDLRVLLDEASEILRLAGQEVRIDSAATGTVRAPAVELRHLVLNLVLNSRDAMGGGGVVELRLSRHGGRARLEVRDHGPGFAPEVLPRVFEPFFTTKG